MVHCGRDRQLELLVGGVRRCQPQSRPRCPGVILQSDLEQEGVVFALPQRLDDHAGTVRHADYSFWPRQALGVADDDVRVRTAEHADHPLRVLLSTLRHR